MGAPKILPKRKKNASSADPRHPHDSTPPPGHRILFVLPPKQRKLRRKESNQKREAKKEQTDDSDRDTDDYLDPLVDSTDFWRVIAKGIDWRRRGKRKSLYA